jgi:hypothetical protein
VPRSSVDAVVVRPVNAFNLLLFFEEACVFDRQKWKNRRKPRNKKEKKKNVKTLNNTKSPFFFFPFFSARW